MTDVADFIDSDADNTIYQGSVQFVCSDNGAQSSPFVRPLLSPKVKPSEIDNILNHQAIIAIEAENNRDPEFLNGPSFEFEGISKNFPTDIVLSQVYEDVFVTAQVIQN